MVLPSAARRVKTTFAEAGAGLTIANPVVSKSAELITLANVSVDCACNEPEVKTKLKNKKTQARIGPKTAATLLHEPTLAVDESDEGRHQRGAEKLGDDDKNAIDEPWNDDVYPTHCL